MRGPRRVRYEVKNGVMQAVLLERHVLREIMDRLWLQARIKVWQINQPVGGKVKQNVPGIPDLIGFIPHNTPRTFDWKAGTVTHQGYPALPLFIEVKKPGGRHRFMQDVFIDEAKQGGCAAFFAESWADVVRELGNFGIRLKGDL